MSARKRTKPLIFCTASYQYMLDALAATGDFTRGKLERHRFPDGELYDRIAGNVSRRDVVLVGGTISAEDTLELYDLGSALVKYGARSLTTVIPYFGYSTMERAVKPGEVVKAKTRARLLSSIPPASEGNRFVLMDLHSEGIPHYFEGGATTFHVYCKDAVKRICKRLARGGDFVLGSTDAGRAKWVESLAGDMGVSCAIILKRRIDARTTKVTGVSADVKGKIVIIYDDMIRTGGSAKMAAQAYLDAGAAKVYLICTHCLLPGDSLKGLEESGLFAQIVVTDTHPRARDLAGQFLEVEPVGDLLARELRTGLKL